MRTFKKDHFAFGAMIGAIVPVIINFLLELITFKAGDIQHHLFEEKTRFVLAIFTNIVPFRIYMVNLKYEKTGKGILLVTFIYAFFYIFKFIQ